MTRSIYFSITLVAAVLGLLMVFQFRTTSSIDRGIPYDRVQELAMEKKQVERDIAQLQEEAADLSAKLNEAGKGYNEAAGALESELAKVRLYAGLTPVQGPGVEVVLENLPGPAGTGLYTIRDDDLLKVLNDLRGAGAEALAVNDQRIIATSEVRMAGNHINVNLTKLSPPYRIKAIGNQAALKSSLEIKGGIAEYLSDLGIKVTVQTNENIFIPAYSGTVDYEFARPAVK
ncbi:MAG: DUF881 domain-containing protein [Pelotomaculum sp.]|nr:DUF881 domain-containing protein [Pelotomaculum sp.]